MVLRISKRMCFLLLCIFVLSACSTNTQKLIVPLTSEVSGYYDSSFLVKDDEEPFKFAIASIMSIRETHRIYNKFLNYLEEELGRPVELVQKQTYLEIQKAFELGEVDAGIVCAYLGVLGNNLGIFERIAMPIRNNDKDFTSYIIVRKDSQFETFTDLKFHSFAFSDPLSYSGFMFPKYYLNKEGFEMSEYFSNTYYTYSHDNTIFAVANGLVDGGATHSNIYKLLQLENNPVIDEIKIIEEGFFVGNSPIVVNPELDLAEKGKLTEIVLKMHLNNKGRKALEKLSINLFIEPEVELYEPINKMLIELGELE